MRNPTSGLSMQNLVFPGTLFFNWLGQDLERYYQAPTLDEFAHVHLLDFAGSQIRTLDPSVFMVLVTEEFIEIMSTYGSITTVFLDGNVTHCHIASTKSRNRSCRQKSIFLDANDRSAIIKWEQWTYRGKPYSEVDPDDNIGLKYSEDGWSIYLDLLSPFVELPQFPRQLVADFCSIPGEDLASGEVVAIPSDKLSEYAAEQADLAADAFYLLSEYGRMVRDDYRPRIMGLFDEWESHLDGPEGVSLCVKGHVHPEMSLEDYRHANDDDDHTLEDVLRELRVVNRS